jgi:hypothetical protein
MAEDEASGRKEAEEGCPGKRESRGQRYAGEYCPNRRGMLRRNLLAGRICLGQMS